uniref:Uncharacterized protein n=1 Tax=Megaselia scalaris TaxID=36166 RepID=T1GQ60_MEGSC
MKWDGGKYPTLDCWLEEAGVRAPETSLTGAVPALMVWLCPPKTSYWRWISFWAWAASSGVLYLMKKTSGLLGCVGAGVAISLTSNSFN